MSKTAWIIFSAVVILLLGGLVVYSRMNSTSIDVSSVDAASVVAASEHNGQIGDHVFNNTESKVVFIEYGDFQCPGCASAHPNIKSVLGEYGDRITFVFRNFPITTSHPNARAAAASAEAASLQGKYWEMHDLLYENQTSWQGQDPTQRTATFTSYAEQIGLNTDQFKTDLASDRVNQKISFDQALGAKVGVNSTPSFYLNGEQLPAEAATGILQGNTSELERLLDEAL